MTDDDSFPVTTGVATDEDESVLRWWCRQNLADCAQWLVRRGLGGALDRVFAEVRAWSVEDAATEEGEFAAAFDGLVRRRMLAAEGAPTTDSDDASPLTERLAEDLTLYRRPLLDGGIDCIRVVSTVRGAVPQFLVQSGELFWPRWLDGALPRQLFEPNQLFHDIRPVTVSWTVFQVPVLAARGRVMTLAQALNMLEYDPV